MSTPAPHRALPLPSITGRWRPRLRLIQLITGVWVTSTLTGLILAPPAAADNCSVFTDCFGVANSAIEAAFGLSLLAALSLILDFVPFVGTAKGGIEAATGRDLLTGRELAPWERALGVLPFIGIAGGALAVGLRHADDLADLAGLGRHLDDVDDLSHAGRLAPSRQVAGDILPIPTGKATQDLIDAYRNPALSSGRKSVIAEKIGEIGALQYARHVSGKEGLTLLRPTSSTDVEQLVQHVNTGHAWDHAIAYNGRNAVNIVYFDGKTLHIIEAKGGGGKYLDRESVIVVPEERISQTHPDYPRDVAQNMAESPLTDGRNELGKVIKEMYRAEQVRYVGVRTGPYADLSAGNPKIIIEHVFKEPLP